MIAVIHLRACVAPVTPTCDPTDQNVLVNKIYRAMNLKIWIEYNLFVAYRSANLKLLFVKLGKESQRCVLCCFFMHCMAAIVLSLVGVPSAGQGGIKGMAKIIKPMNWLQQEQTQASQQPQMCQLWPLILMLAHLHPNNPVVSQVLPM